MKANILFIIVAIILCVLALATSLASITIEKPMLQPVVADVNIIPAGPTAPTIVRFANPIGILAGPYTPIIGGTTATHFSVLMEDLNGNTELPGSPTFPVLINTVGANVITGVLAPLSAPDPTMSRLASLCIPVDCPALLAGPGLNLGIACDIGREPLQRAMVCTTNLGQTDPPGNWRFSIGIADSTTLNSGIALSLDASGLYPQTAIYNTLTAAYFGTIALFPTSITPENFLWTGLSSTGTNQISTPVTITNVGNIASGVISATGTDLGGVNIITSILSKTAFRLSTNNGGTLPAQCTSGIQLSGVSQVIPTATLPYTQTYSLGTGTDTEVIFACIPNTPISSITGAIDTQYRTLIGQDWTFNI